MSGDETKISKEEAGHEVNKKIKNRLKTKSLNKMSGAASHVVIKNAKYRLKTKPKPLQRLSGSIKINKEELDEAAHEIENINLEINLFLQKFREFKKHNFGDKNLMQNLLHLYDEINNFLETEPSILETDAFILKTETNLKFNINNIGIHRIYTCNFCSLEVGTTSKHIVGHICDMKHKKMEESFNESKINDNNLEENGITNNEIEKPAVQEVITKEKGKRIRGFAKKQIHYTNSRKLPKRAKLFLDNDFGKLLTNCVVTGNKLRNIPAYEKIEKSLLDSIKPIYPDVRVHFFGSRISGLGNLDSDLDIFLDIGNVFNLHNPDQKDVIKKLKVISNNLKNNKIEWNNIIEIKDARVPILQAFNKTFRIDCDIGFSNGLGPMNTLLTKYIFQLQPICHKMCFFLKKWIKVTSLKFQFSTYTFVMMAIFFLQTKKELPTIRQLQEDIKEPFEIGPWQGDINTHKKLKDFKIELISSDNKKCLEYLIEFFDYFKNFNFDEYAISPYCGKLIHKPEFNNLEIHEFPRYKDYYRKNPDKHKIKLNTPICVQDPLELNHNIAKGVSRGILDLMKEYCEATEGLLAIKYRE